MIRTRFGLSLMAAALSLMTVAPEGANAFNRGQPTFPFPIEQTPGSQVFEVIENQPAGPRDIWCAAAQHAQRDLRLPNAQRLYLAKARGPSALVPGRSSVGFSPVKVDAIAPKQDGGSAVSLRDIGFSLSIGHAAHFCTEPFDDVFDLF